jgi:hypothetical protein
MISSLNEMPINKRRPTNTKKKVFGESSVE